MTFPRSLDWLDALAFYEIAAVMKEFATVGRAASKEGETAPSHGVATR
jgi:hypothetical protein